MRRLTIRVWVRLHFRTKRSAHTTPKGRFRSERPHNAHAKEVHDIAMIAPDLMMKVTAAIKQA